MLADSSPLRCAGRGVALAAWRRGVQSHGRGITIMQLAKTGIYHYIHMRLVSPTSALAALRVARSPVVGLAASLLRQGLAAPPSSAVYYGCIAVGTGEGEGIGGRGGIRGRGRGEQAGQRRAARDSSAATPQAPCALQSLCFSTSIVPPPPPD